MVKQLYMKKGLLHTIHSITGLIAGIFILILSVSGAILVFHDEIDSWQQPIVSSTPADSARADLNTLYACIQEKFPAAQISHAMLPSDMHPSVSFFIYDSSYKKGQKSLEVFLDPVTAAIIDQRGGANDPIHHSMAWMASLHDSFLLGKKGEWLLGFLGSCFLISLLTGCILYRKSIVAVLLSRPLPNKGNRLHQVIGVWTLCFNLLIGVSGLWMQRYVFQKDFYTATTYVKQIKKSDALRYNVDTAFEKMAKKYPDFTAHIIYFPFQSSGKMAIYGSKERNAFIYSKDLTDLVLLDSAGNISTTRFVNEIPAADRRDIINAQLHFGRYGGWPVKIIYAILGLCTALLSITGFVLWRRRKKYPSII